MKKPALILAAAALAYGLWRLVRKPACCATCACQSTRINAVAGLRG